MAEFSAVYTLNTSGTDITFNSGTDSYQITNISGLDGIARRAPIDVAPQTDGGIVHTFFKDVRHITIEGILLVRSSATESGYVTARNTMENNLVSALDSCYQADATLQWTPTGGSSRTLTVRNDVAVQFTGALLKSFIFGLVAANPNWS